MSHRGAPSHSRHGGRLPRLRPAVGANKLLRRHRDYQLILRLPLRRAEPSYVTLGGLRGGQRNAYPFFHIPLSGPFPRGRDSGPAYFIPAHNGQEQPSRGQQ